MDKKITVSVLLDFYGQLLSEKQLTIMNCYYNEDLSLREIADIVGMTRQGVYDIIRRSDNFLKELENKLCLYHKWQSIEKDLDNVETALQTLPKKITADSSAVCEEYCREIIDMIEQIKNKF